MTAITGCTGCARLVVPNGSPYDTMTRGEFVLELMSRLEFKREIAEHKKLKIAVELYDNAIETIKAAYTTDELTDCYGIFDENFNNGE